MTKEELEKEVEDEGVKYADSLKFTIPKFSDEEGYCWSQVEQAYEKGALDFAEPREKQIKVLTEENKTAKKIIKGLLIILRETANDEYDFEKACPYQYEEAEQFLKEDENDKRNNGK